MGTLTSKIALPLFGFITMAILLNVKFYKLTKKHIISSSLFIVGSIVLNVFVYKNFGLRVYQLGYILWVQIPLYFIFSILSPYKGIKLLFVLLTTISFAALPVNISIGLKTFWGLSNLILSIFLIMLCALLILLIYRFLKLDFNYILEYGTSQPFLKFCLIPILYYIYGFFISDYSFEKTFSSNGFFIKRIPDIIVFFSFFLLVSIFRRTREQEQAQKHEMILSMQLDSAFQQVLQMKSIQLQTATYRHDMRHHLALITGYLADGNIIRAKEYLTQVGQDIDSICPQIFCENETVNLILSSLMTKAKNEGVSLIIETQIPNTLSIGDTELCGLLCNLVENAIHAASIHTDPEKKEVRIISKLSKENKLLLFIQNFYTNDVMIQNGLPSSNRSGHGYGIKSVETILKQHGGMSSYEAADGIFTTRIVI